MLLFDAVIWRDSVLPLKFPFSCEISLVFHLKYSCSCFSSPFCFLVIVVLFILVLFVLFLVTLISLSLFFFMLSFGGHIDVLMLSSMLVSPLPPSFFDTYSLSMSSLGCKVLCIIIIIIIIILFLASFFIPILTGFMSVNSEWQQVFSSLQNSSKYPSWFLNCCDLDNLHSSFNLWFTQALSQILGDCSKDVKLQLLSLSLHVPLLFQLSIKVQISIYLFSFFYFDPMVY